MVTSLSLKLNLELTTRLVPSQVTVDLMSRGPCLFMTSLPSVVKLAVVDCLPCWVSAVVLIFNAGSACSITSVRLAGAGSGPQTLFRRFSFQVPLKFGLPFAPSPAPHAATANTH